MLWPAPLSFAPHAERKFLIWYTDYISGKVRSGLWFALGLMLVLLFANGPFHDIRQTAFGESPGAWFELLRIGLILPSALLMLAVTYSRYYSRYYVRVASIIAPLLCVACIGLDLLMYQQGYLLSSWMVLVVVSPYQLFALPHRRAILTTHLTLIVYLVVTVVFDLYNGQRQFDFAVMCVAVCLSGSGHYMMQKAMRRGYLDSRRLANSAQRDGLTSLFNRRAFDDHMHRMWQQAARSKLPLAVLMIDVDCFKLLNDSLGHQTGDHYLVRLSAVLAAAARRPMDIVTRYGGEEFAIALWDADRVVAQEISQRLLIQVAAMGLPHPASQAGNILTVSVGVACIEPQSDRTYYGAIQLADEALYAAKAQGRNRMVIRDKEYLALRTGAFRSSLEPPDRRTTDQEPTAVCVEEPHVAPNEVGLCRE